MNEHDDPLIGSVVMGRYHVVRLLALGGMGAIYLARIEGAAGVNVPAVIKRVLAGASGNDSAAVKQFVREAKILSTLRHPGIVGILDFTDEDGDYLMAMEYVHGHSLDRWLRYVTQARGAFSVELAVHIAIQVLDALHYAHTLRGGDGASLEIIHRDVTPSNVLIDASGHVKLADFGIARSKSERTTDVTGDASLKGKMPYIAPELFAKKKPTPTCDVYSVAVLLHEVLLGRNEFAATHPVATMYNVLNVVPQPLNEVRGDVSKALAEVVARGLSKDPSKRYATAMQFATALRGARDLDSDSAQAQLAATVGEDFFSPEMAKVTGVDLPTLDRALREVSGAVGAQGTGRFAAVQDAAGDGATVVARRTRRSTGSGMLVAPQSVPAPNVAPAVTPAGASATEVRPIEATQAATRTSRGALLGVALGAIALVAVLGVVAFVALRPAQPAQVVYVDGRLGGELSALPSVTAAPSASESFPLVPVGPSARASVAPSATASALPTGRPVRPSHTGPSASAVVAPSNAPPEDLVRRTLGREVRRIQSCFDQHPGALTAESTVQLRFTVGTSGDVTSAELGPPVMASSPAAPCVLSVVRGLTFGVQPSTMTLRTQFTVRPVR